jgi:hypothetical protein
MGIKKLWLGICGTVALGVVTLSSTPARATPNVTCTVNNVAWTEGSGGTVQIYCSGIWYFAFGTQSGCNTTSSDGKKAYQSMAQGALLSGKTLYIEYTTCGSGNAISYVRL